MPSLLFYGRDGVPVPSVEDCTNALRREPGISLGAAACTGYQSAEWRDPATLTTAHIDAGHPITQHEVGRAKIYAGWQPWPLAIHLSLSAPHWHCLEVADLAERIRTRLGHEATLLNSEDTSHDDGSDGPGPLSRERLLAAWVNCHKAAALALPRLDRQASLALWRYRKARTGDWPQALVLASVEDPVHATSCALWSEPAAPLVVPPVQYLVLVRGLGDAGLLPVDEVLIAARDAAQPLPDGLSRRLPSTPRLRELFARAKLMPADRWRFCAEHEWGD